LKKGTKRKDKRRKEQKRKKQEKQKNPLNRSWMIKAHETTIPHHPMWMQR
jgi:hypothetical protein